MKFGVGRGIMGFGRFGIFTVPSRIHKLEKNIYEGKTQRTSRDDGSKR